MVRRKNAPRQAQQNLVVNSNVAAAGHSGTIRNDKNEESDVSIDDLINDSDEESDYEPPKSWNIKRTEENPECTKKRKYNKTPKTEKKITPKSALKISITVDYGVFQDVLDNSLTRVRIDLEKNVHHDKNVYCLFGEVKIQANNFSKDALKVDVLYLYVGNKNCSSAIFLEWYDPNAYNANKFEKPNLFKYFYIDEQLDTKLWQVIGTQKKFLIACDRIEGEILYLNIYLLNTAFVSLRHSYEHIYGTKFLPHTVKCFYDIDTKNEGLSIHGGKKADIKKLYQVIKEAHTGIKYSDIDPQHQELIPTLRPYQIRAVKWMMYQETRDLNPYPKAVHPLYKEIISLDGKRFYYNIVTGFFVKDKPVITPSSPGGILADEMGLGKTVEVLALILCHPKPEDFNEDHIESESGIDKNLNEDSMNLRCSTKLNDKNCQNFYEYTDTIENSQEKLIKNKENIKCDENEFHLDTAEIELCKYVCDIKGNSNFEIKNTNEDKQGENINNNPHPKAEISQCESGKKFSKTKPTRRKISHDDSVESANSESFDPDINHSQKSETFEMNSSPYLRKRKRSSRTSSQDENFSDKEKVPSRKRAKVIFNPAEEISKSPALSIIQKVIIDKVWDGNLDKYKKSGSYKDFNLYLKKKHKNVYHMMSMREVLNYEYQNKLKEFKCSSKRQTIKNFFDTKVAQKSFFECICGGDDPNKGLTKVQCGTCSLFQHASCVGFDMEDPTLQKFICPHCWATEKPVPSGATLIVSPASISYQWMDEISKHIKEKGLKVYVYEGVSSKNYVQPRKLASYDLVIVTYCTLQRELNYCDLPHSNSDAGRRFRHPKRFMAMPSPLPAVEWWRICLDEAQMVESVMTRTAQMVLRLRSINKWCVTGTPIQKSIEDLQGLLMFLGDDPYRTREWWDACLYAPYCNKRPDQLNAVMSKYMWRSSKRDVKNELGIPPQTEKIHWLDFNAVEEHFYMRLRSDCSDEALKKLCKYEASTKLQSLDSKSLSILLQPLLRLRQACNHPQIVRGYFTTLNRNKKLTMEQLLENLLKRTKIEAEDSHRIIVASWNGLAALDVINEDVLGAVEKYRAILSSIEKHKNDFKTDSLQKLHTIHNLNELLTSHPDLGSHTLRDEKFGQEAAQIRDEYLKHYPDRTREIDVECVQNTQEVKESKAKLKSKIEWWIIALESLGYDFVEEAREELLSQWTRFEQQKCILYSIHSKPQLLMLLKDKIKELTVQRKEMINSTRELLKRDPNELLNSAIDCHLRPSEVESATCALCVSHEIFPKYEENLFFTKDAMFSKTRSTDRSKKTKDMLDKLQMLDRGREGNWGQSEIEKVLRFLQTKALGLVDAEILEDAHAQTAMFRAMKKEFKNFRVLWRAVYDHISALDEVNMATIRYRVRLEGEEPIETKKKEKLNPLNELEKKVDAPTYVLEKCEVAQQELKLRSEKLVYQNELKTKLGQLFYLKNLKKVNFDKGGENSEPCPICKGVLGAQWRVLVCGHGFCLDCMSVLLIRAAVVVKCPICRQSSKVKEIATVVLKKPQEQIDNNVRIIGSLSTKTEGLVREVLNITTEDPGAKILVFSSWVEVLNVISDAFSENGIMHRILKSTNKFQANLKSFKRNPEITALLLPVSSGANGLNIVEARHVMLVEPLMNTGAEFQAIGRVHRIGQTHSTTVHRFLIRNTIEERIHNILNEKHSHNDDTDFGTINDLLKLFSKDDCHVNLNSSLESEDHFNDRSDRLDDQSDLSDSIDHYYEESEDESRDVIDLNENGSDSESVSNRNIDLNEKNEDLNGKNEDINDLNGKNEDVNSKNEDLNDRNTDLNIKNKDLIDNNADLIEKNEHINDKNCNNSDKNSDIIDRSDKNQTSEPSTSAKVLNSSTYNSGTIIDFHDLDYYYE